MNWRKRFDLWWIRTLIPPTQRGPLAFKKAVREAKRILILSPPEESFLSSKFSQLISLFKVHAQEIHVLILGEPPTGWRGNEEAIWMFLSLKKPSLFHYRRSQPLQDLLAERFDLFIDLHREPQTLGPYLCRKGHIPLCIGLDGCGVESFYNLIFHGKDLSGLSDFLKGLLQ